MAGVVACALLMACGAEGPRQEVPAATLGRSTQAEEDLRPLVRRWTLGTTAERQALDPELKAFCDRHPGDDLVRLALVLRGFNALERGQLDKARSLVRGSDAAPQGSPLFGPAGTTRDLATLVLGASERRSGEHDRALTRLAPLLHKMLDGFATAMLDEELVLGAVGAKRWAAALFLMDVWQREVEPDRRAAVQRQIRQLIAEVPTSELLASLEQRVARMSSEEGGDMARLLTQELAVRAVGERDHALARVLLQRFGTLLGEYGEAVAQLAVDTSRARVSSRTVGVLLSTRSPELSRRSADLMAGMAFGLGLPGSAARLVSRSAPDDDERVRVALAELATEGAAVVVAAVDPAHAEPAMDYAADSSLPVLLLSEGGSLPSSPFLFVVGESGARSTGLLAAELRKQGASVLAGLGVSGVAGEGDVALEQSCLALPLPLDMRAAGVKGLLVYDGAYCDEDLTTLTQTLRLPVAAGLGAVLPELPGRVTTLSAGIFPVDVSRPDRRLTGWLEGGRGAPSWWHALGRDAAVLAWLAVEGLTETGTEGGKDEVRARRVEAASALAAAEAELWTSEARGFGGQQRLPRQLEVTDVAGR